MTESVQTATNPVPAQMPHRRCQGPNCGRNLPNHVPPPVPPSSSNGDRSAITQEGYRDSLTGLSHGFGIRDDLPLEGFSFRIERPPRG